MLKILSIFGTRPEAVKMAPVVRALACAPGIEARVCVTAQHREMLDQVLELFDIRPDYDLDLMRPDQSLSQLTSAVFTHLEPVLQDMRPDWVLVQGDTTTVMASALLAYYHRICVGHVEAGLRTGDKWQPFPEEINRKVAGAVADLHFAPTTWARDNLLREGISPEKIVVTGNTVIDALHTVVSRPETPQTLALLEHLGLNDAGSPASRLILVTAHRRENFGKPLENICLALRELALRYPQHRLVYPVHLNPRVQEPVYRMLGGVPNIHLLKPLDYLPLIHLLKRAALVLTDSGGLQEEAPGLGVPVLVLREVTERPEGVTAGMVRLVGTDTDRILAEASRLLDDPQAHAAMAQAVNPYGDGAPSSALSKQSWHIEAAPGWANNMARDLVTALVYARSRPLLGRLAYYALKLLGVEIPRSVRVGRNLELAHGGFGVVVHSRTQIGDDVKIYPGVGLGRADIYRPMQSSQFEGIVIEDQVILSPGAKILGKAGTLVVRRGSVVGANAVLLQSTGEWEIWAGVPARCVGRRDPQDAAGLLPPNQER